MEMKISDELARIVAYAREEAMRTGSYAIGVDHLLLGILRSGGGDAMRALMDLGIDPDDIKKYVESQLFRADSISYSEMDKIVFSKHAQSILNLCILEAGRLGHPQARPVHLLLAISRSGDSICQPYLLAKGVNYSRLFEYMQRSGMLSAAEPSASEADKAEEEGNSGDGAPAGPDSGRLSPLDEYGFDITAAASAGKLDPVVGREDEISRVVEILGRRRKNNPMLVGDAGVGKSAIVEGLAQRIASGDIPQVLMRKRIVSLDMAAVVAGTKFRGDFEKRMKEIISSLRDNPDTILFIDEFHTIIGAGGAHGSIDAANMLKPALARGEIQCIGATTTDEFSRIVEKDGALDRRFQKVVVDPMDVRQSLSVLERLCPSYEEYHGVHYTAGALQECVRLTDRYIIDKALPDKAIDAMDESGSMVRLAILREHRGKGEVDAEDVAAVVSKMTGIPLTKVAESEGARLLHMHERLRSRIVGQDEAVDTVVRAIRRNRAGVKDPGRPIGSFLFFGSTGVGKTQLAKCLAEYLFDSEDNLVRIDMSEYGEKFSTSRLIGAPPGYVGYEEGGQLSERVRRKPYCVVLLDEIEKAHPDVFNLLLQVLDEGRLTDSQGRSVSFKNTIVIMTSNVGTKELENYGSGIGFASASKDMAADRRSVLTKAVRSAFPPEFINRVDEQVFFNTLSKEDLEKIIDISLGDLKERVAEAGYKLSVSAPAKRFVAEAGYDPVYGARPLKRAVTRYIEDPVSEYIIADRLLHPGSASQGPVTLKVVLTKDKTTTEVRS